MENEIFKFSLEIFNNIRDEKKNIVKYSKLSNYNILWKYTRVEILDSSLMPLFHVKKIECEDIYKDEFGKIINKSNSIINCKELYKIINLHIYSTGSSTFLICYNEKIIGKKSYIPDYSNLVYIIMFYDKYISQSFKIIQEFLYSLYYFEQHMSGLRRGFRGKNIDFYNMLLDNFKIYSDIDYISTLEEINYKRYVIK